MSMTILLVEDNEMNRDMMKRRLERKGFTVIVAVDGQEAIRSARENKPDLVLLDLSLPLVDGWTVARTLRAMDETARLPILALTAHAMPGDRAKALEAGCDEYETKPVEMADLLAKIEALTGKQSGPP